MLLLRDGKVLEIIENGLILAAVDFATFANAGRPREPGDRFLLYTDGLVDAANAKGDFFGQDALSAVLPQTAELAPSAASDRLHSPAMVRFAGRRSDSSHLRLHPECIGTQSGCGPRPDSKAEH
jgi:phosphoserine phosphatase RsbU/P